MAVLWTACLNYLIQNSTALSIDFTEEKVGGMKPPFTFGVSVIFCAAVISTIQLYFLNPSSRFSADPPKYKHSMDT